MEDAIDMQFKVDPTSALQALCTSRDWMPPKYHFFLKGGKQNFSFSASCAVMKWTVRVEGLTKEEAGRQAAAKMYRKIQNVEGNILLGNAYFGLDYEPITAVEVKAPAVPTLVDDTRAAKIDEFPMLDMSQTSLAEPDTDRPLGTIELLAPYKNYVTSANESVSSPVSADLANRLRLSNNPSVRELKALNSISEITVPSCTEFMLRIVEEEGLKMKLTFSTSYVPPKGKDFRTVRPATSALRTFGYGETMYDCKKHAALECLFRFKLMLTS